MLIVVVGNEFVGFKGFTESVCSRLEPEELRLRVDDLQQMSMF